MKDFIPGPRLQEPDQNVEDLRECVEEWESLISECSTVQSGNGARYCEYALELTEDISNMHCEHECSALLRANATILLDY